MIKVLRSKMRDQHGQSMVEMALVLPILILLVFGIIEYGRIYTHQLEINAAVRQGARIASVNNKSNDSINASNVLAILEKGTTGSLGAVTNPATISGTQTARITWVKNWYGTTGNGDIIIVRTPVENLTATPPIRSTTVKVTIHYPHYIFTPIISNLFADKNHIRNLTAEVVMMIE